MRFNQSHSSAPSMQQTQEQLVDFQEKLNEFNTAMESMQLDIIKDSLKVSYQKHFTTV